MKEDDIKELKRRGFNSNIEQKPKRRYNRGLNHLTDISSFVFLMLILLFIVMLLLIPQAIYYLKLLEDLA
jgi:hypothetical protein